MNIQIRWRNLSQSITVLLYASTKLQSGTVVYDYHGFYVASGNSKADIFRYVETGRKYIPCENSLQGYQRDRLEKISEGC